MSISKVRLRYFFLLSFSMALIVAGCKKSNTQHDGGGGSGYYIDFKDDGSSQNYKNDVLFTVTDESPGLPGYGMTVVGADSSTLFNGMFIVLTSTQPFAAGQTYNATALPNSDQLSAYITFIAPSGLTYFSDSLTVSVTLTALNDSIVTGTFSGKVFNKDVTDKPVYMLTEGSFRASK